MQYTHHVLIMHFLSKKTIFDPQKHFFAQGLQESANIATNLNIATK